MNTKVHFSSATSEWTTPQDVFEELNREFGFTLDPCCTKETAKCSKFYTAIDNGLLQDWKDEIVFMNPPYGREISSWMRKAFDEHVHATIVCLIPSRTDTRWWHEYVMKADEIRFIRGRLKFGNNKSSAPFPSAIIVFRVNPSSL